MRIDRLASLATALVLAALPAAAQQYVYPAKGQSKEQQKQDEAACHQWAVEQSKYDPANLPQAAPPPQKTGPTGARVRGAAAGAIVGEAVSGDASSGAAAGAVAGGVAQRSARRQQAAAAQQQASQQQQAGQAAFQKARGACLEGKGYSVK